MKTVFREILEQTQKIEGVGTKFVGTAIMVASMEQRPPGTLPDNDVAIAGMIGLDLDKWIRVKDKILIDKWMKDGARWVNVALLPRQVKTQPITFNLSELRFDGITEKHRAAWQTINPCAELDYQLHLAAVYLLDHPRKVASTRNFSSYITKWMKASIQWGRRQVRPLDNPEEESSEKFNVFWLAYSDRRKTQYGHAAAIWKANGLDRHADAIMAGLERWKRSMDWAANNGEFIPAPDKWLLGKRWLDIPAAHQVQLIKDRSGRVIAHDPGDVERNYGQIGAF